MKRQIFTLNVFFALIFGCSITTRALQWEQLQGYRRAAVNPGSSGKTGFTLLSQEETGIHFTNTLTLEKSLANHNHLQNGAGLAAADMDGDGWIDIYFCDKQGNGRLYRNVGGKFQDFTAESGIATPNMFQSGALFEDINGDGIPDLIITSYGGPNACFLNDGKGHFKNVTEEAGLILKAGSGTMTMADIDGNGTLDLYIANYGEFAVFRTGAAISVRYSNGQPYVTGRYGKRIKIINGQMIELGEPHVLYLNDGKGHFKPVSWTDGTFLDEEGKALTTEPLDMGLSAMFRDINQDGFPDLYVCNDFQTPDRIWINDGKGHFRALPRNSLRKTSQFSMGVDFADINRDGLDDFVVVDMLSRDHKLKMQQSNATNAPIEFTGEKILDRPQYRQNTLFLNRGDGTYGEIAHFAGLEASEWSWCPVFLDVDLDGYEDLLVVNGNAYDTQDLDTIADSKIHPSTDPRHAQTRYPKLQTPNMVFRNKGDLRFEEMGHAWGFESTQVSHGIVLADIDNDGDLDVIINCYNAPPLVYRNESSAPRIGVRLKGKGANTRGIGARITVNGGPVVQSQEVISGGRYLSGDDPMRVFATGKGTNLTIDVRWRSGVMSHLEGITPNAIYEIEEPAGAPANVSLLKKESALFEDVSPLLHYRSATRRPDDLEKQSSLYRRLDIQGPPLTWMDGGKGKSELLTYDEVENAILDFDLLKPGASNRKSTKQTGSGQIRRILNLGLEEGKFLTVAIDPANPVLAKLQAGVEAKPAGNAALQGVPGAMCAADVNGDGLVDLFMAGGWQHGKYPQPGAACLMLRKGEQWVLDEANRQAFANLGLVTGAVFTDLDGDGWQDLVVACEWGSVKVFMNRNGKFGEKTKEWGLDKWTGWWTTVAVGDFNGDGKPDLVCGNWGLNTPYRASAEDPAVALFGDFNQTGETTLLEGYSFRPAGKLYPRRNMDSMAAIIPFLREKYVLNKIYATATLEEMLGPRIKDARRLTATTLATTLFLNEGTTFKAVPLPDEAQFSPVFGIGVADFDGDGKEDLFLAQNFSQFWSEVPRADSGRGLLLLGTGDGSFKAATGQKSGIIIYDDQRSVAIGDYDGDGRPDLAVNQWNDDLKLFHNLQAVPQLTVRLEGPRENPNAIGARVRLTSGDYQSPVKEIHAGNGGPGQDSMALLFKKTLSDSKISIRWPNQKTTETIVPPNSSSITIDPSGILAK
ncbi:MAG: Repeat protein [Verrucomicrobiales bacterium]|nr:Repeat protein [Verrucomicrobiales bacterium]